MNEENPIPENEGLVLNDKVKSDLIPTVKWAKIFFIVQCVSIVYHIILAISNIFKGSSLPNAPESTRIMNGLIGVVMLPLILFLIYPTFKLYQFVTGMRRACQTDSTSEAEQGLAGMQSFCHFYGVLGFVAMCLLAIPLSLIIISLFGFIIADLGQHLSEV